VVFDLVAVDFPNMQAVPDGNSNVVRQGESGGGKTDFDQDGIPPLEITEMASIVARIALGAQVLDRETMLRDRPGDSF
jgi:hypothetical protein